MTNNYFRKIFSFLLVCFYFLMFHTEVVPGRLTVPEIFQVNYSFMHFVFQRFFEFSLMKHRAGPSAGTDIPGKRKEVPWNTSLPERIQVPPGDPQEKNFQNEDTLH